MKLRIYYISLFCFSYLGISIAFFPADHALSLVKDRLGEIIMNHPEGTLWRGKTASLQGHGILLTHLRWQLSPLSLLTGKIQLTLDANYQNRAEHLSVTLSNGNHVSLHDVALQWPLDTLPLTLPRTLTPGGLIRTSIDRADIKEQRLTYVHGNVKWQQATLGDAPLGEYTLTLETKDSVIHGTISSQDNDPLQASGQLTLQENGQYTIDLILTITATANPALRRNLAMMGKIATDGTLPLHFQGHVDDLKNIFP